MFLNCRIFKAANIQIKFSSTSGNFDSHLVTKARLNLVKSMRILFSHVCGKKFSSRDTAHAQNKYEKCSTSGTAPKRRIERCSPRFQPGDRFWSRIFRHLSPGSEGKKCRPLDYTKQIPFIHSGEFCN